jgi:hypothetical protein
MMKYCKVDMEGQLSLEGDPRLLYSIMLGIRSWIVNVSWKYLGYGVTIATRYAVLRRQFTTLDDNKRLERKLLDYQAH